MHLHLNDLRIIEKVILFSKDGRGGFSNERSRWVRRRDEEGSLLKVLSLTRDHIEMRKGLRGRLEVGVGGEKLLVRSGIEGSRRRMMERSEVRILVLVLILERMMCLLLERRCSVTLVSEGILLMLLLVKERLIASDEGSKREIVRSSFRIEELLLLLLLLWVERRSRVEEGSIARS